MPAITTYAKKSTALIEQAKRWLAVREVGGPNKGADVERFQKTVDGKASGEPWCLCFVQFCVREVDRQYAVKNPKQSAVTTWIFPTEHCMTMFNKTHAEARLDKPEPGCLVVWGWFKDGKATGSGHVGIVTEVVGDAIHTIEGNTGDGAGINREGDGVYKRVRSLKADPAASFRIMGFIAAWPKQDASALVA